MTSLLQKLTTSSGFQHTITGVILLSAVMVGLETSTAMVTRFGVWLQVAELAVTTVFVTELVLRLASYGRQPWRFFLDGWNVFDFVIVTLCLLPATGPFAAVLRLARVLRLLRLISALPKLQLLVGALLKSLGAMGYVALLLALVSYIYAVAGVHLFGAHDPENFGSLSPALHSLLRVITLDNWSELFLSAERGAPVLAVIYFVSFILLGTMIMLNLFIGIVMNSMSAMHAELAGQQDAVADRELNSATPEDDLQSIEDALKETHARLAVLRRNREQIGRRGDRSRNTVDSRA